MFGLGVHSGTTPDSVDPDEERTAPPTPTAVHFPDVHLKLASNEEWVKDPPNLVDIYQAIRRPQDVTEQHLEALNLEVQGDVELEDLIPKGSEDEAYLPPKDWTKNLDPDAKRSSLHIPSDSGPVGNKQNILSNGAKAPDGETFRKNVRDLAHETEDGLRGIARRKPRSGRKSVNFHGFREFWAKLEKVSQYWDSSIDSYYDAGKSAASSPATSPKPLRRLSLVFKDRASTSSMKSNENTPNSKKESSTRRYKGWRRSTGSRMPEYIRVEGDIGFKKDHKAAVLDLAREVAALLLLAQERQREGKKRVVPGEDKWYTTKRRWGGGPGGEFGEAEGNTDAYVNTGQRRYSIPGGGLGTIRKPTEEEIWKDISPGEGQWEPRTTYVCVGKDRNVAHDTVFMISSIFHHISILKLEVHPLYIEFMLTGQKPPSESLPDNSWCRLKMFRSRWYDLLSAEDRVEAYRGIWGVFAYLMRAEGTTPRAKSTEAPRGASLAGNKFNFRHSIVGEPHKQQRSKSVAF
ncbi:MAG: hypothetical protein M1831_006253 [Alyxoria varia]|nr:MAG: hypothetical protein M1831_006253 [Alyxoria varia]